MTAPAGRRLVLESVARTRDSLPASPSPHTPCPRSWVTRSSPGLPVVAGLWALVAALSVYVVFGSSPQLSVGPESTTALMTAVTIAPLAGGDPRRHAALAAALALLVACPLRDRVDCPSRLLGGPAVQAGAGRLHGRRGRADDRRPTRQAHGRPRRRRRTVSTSSDRSSRAPGTSIVPLTASRHQADGLDEVGRRMWGASMRSRTAGMTSSTGGSVPTVRGGGPIVELERHRGRHAGGCIGGVITGRCTLCQPARPATSRWQHATQLGEVGNVSAASTRPAPPPSLANEASRITLRPGQSQRTRVSIAA